MSSTITITTSNTYNLNDDPSYVGTLRLTGADAPDQREIGHHTQGGQGKADGLGGAIDDLNLPSWLKDFAKSALGLDGSAAGPSDSSAAKTINDFQKDKDIGLLSVGQMKQMADTGYITGKDGKTTQVPEEVQQAAQKMMSNNGELFKKLESATDGKHDGQLGQGDYGNAIKDGTISKDTGGTSGPQQRGLSNADFLNAIMNGNLSSSKSSEYDAAKTMNGFQKEHGIGLMSSEQVKQMADTGYFKDKDGNMHQVPEEVQGAAQKMMENNGALFKKLESATDGKHDGQLGQGDFDEALKDGSISKQQTPDYSGQGADPILQALQQLAQSSGQNGAGSSAFMDALREMAQGGQQDGGADLPSSASSAKTINDFQKDKGIGLLSVDQVKQMADTGYITDKDGKTTQVPEEVQQAAQKLMANNGELFKKLESATDGKHDGQLGQGDYGKAIDDGTIAKDTGGTQGANGGQDADLTALLQQLGLGDGSTSGANLPSSASSAKTINDFQKDKDIGLLSVDQVKQMADTGYVTGKDGKTVQVPEEVQQAAQKLMDNNGELFKKLESATDGKHDGQLGQGDYGNAVKDGTVAA